MATEHIERIRAAKRVTKESSLLRAIEAANIGETNKKILRMRYIDGRMFEYIASELGYSTSQIYRRHKASMVIVAAILRETE